jgi:tRNA nucleotidyltransferase/poly(A) polymerase
MKIDISKILTSDINFIFEKVDKIMIVGGAVRDLIAFGTVSKDIDFATPLHPNEIKNIFLQHKDWVVITTGEKFGSIIVLSKKSNKIYDITTLRSDINTDGRHAEVIFDATFESDSKRRDFTINALYLDRDGTVYDFNNGLQDLYNKKVRFIGNAEARINEDYLRIMRFFRFSAKFGGDLDNEGFVACKKLTNNIIKISKERFTSELVGIAKDIFGHEMLIKMQEIGLFFGLHEAPILHNRLLAKDREITKQQIITMLFSDEKILTQLDLTKNEIKFIKFCWQNDILNWSQITKQNKLLALNCDKIMLQYSLQINEHLPQKDKDFLLNIPSLPINGNDLLAINIEPKQIGLSLKKACEIWVDGDFKYHKEMILFLISSK